MEEVEATLYDGENVIIAGIAVLLDARDAPGGGTDAPGWHAHASLPLSIVIEPIEDLRLVTTDGREAIVEEREPTTVEGDRVLHLFTGVSPLAPAGA